MHESAEKIFIRYFVIGNPRASVMSLRINTNRSVVVSTLPTAMTLNQCSSPYEPSSTFVLTRTVENGQRCVAIHNLRCTLVRAK